MRRSVEVHTTEPVLSADRDSISFVAYLDGKKVDCTITGVALKSYFHDDQKPLMDVFSEHQETIGSMAAFLLSSGHQFADGALVIQPEDMRRYQAES